ncbi:MAG: type II toxin-antitoxin system VapC family toxin [Thermoguttaceae bacterium]
MIIVDTHVIVWAIGNQSKLSREAKRALESADILGYSAISLWEVAMLHQKARIGVGRPVEEWMADFTARPEYRLLPITPQVAIRSGKLKMHGDPADRLIVATALEYGVPLVTADHSIRATNALPTVW